MKESDVISGYKFIYISNPLLRRGQPNIPVGVIAYKFENPEATPTSIAEDGKVVVVAGVSRCNPNDNFVKRVGRVKAAGRAASNKYSHRVTVYPVEEYEPGTGQWWRALEHDVRVNVLAMLPAPAREVALNAPVRAPRVGQIERWPVIEARGEI